MSRKDEPVILNGAVRHCPLGIITRSSKGSVFAECHYFGVCPTPCTPEQRIAMQGDEEKKECGASLNQERIKK